ncbi:DsbA family protein [Sphingomonas sp. PP-CC-3A-396]|uniref:DsbA family protein n=1 Tax=Sphingomonas sp. PP-CC-3A-396 TaxID=2135655 RepID=UPI00104A7C1C|nr:DsbA family protein [Sphingomonas sp. PP-CC-3A-396]TCQ07120.1 putative protein-disulfide isomerase [Sphingomonas sp. PP-CC-3A-396]
MTTHFLYLFDPLCGWCYAASAGIATLADQAGVIVEPLPSGLFAGDGARALGGDMRDHILASDRRIATSTGAVFGDHYRDRIVRGASLTLDSGPATLALTAVAQTAPYRELGALRAIQRARYVDGRDITDMFVLIDLLVDAGLDEAAVMLANPEPALREADRQRLERARSVMQGFGTNGVPALFRIDGTMLTPVDATSLYQDPLSLISFNHLA